MRVGVPQYTPLQTRPDYVYEVDPATVATDSFMTNVHLVLLHFAEPFMDAQYTKVSGAGLYLTLILMTGFLRSTALIRTTMPTRQELTSKKRPG